VAQIADRAEMHHAPTLRVEHARLGMPQLHDQHDRRGREVHHAGAVAEARMTTDHHGAAAPGVDVLFDPVRVLERERAAQLTTSP